MNRAAINLDRDLFNQVDDRILNLRLLIRAYALINLTARPYSEIPG